MNHFHELYRIEDLPVLQNRVYDSAAAARDCARGNVVLVEDLASGLVYNSAFRPELITYDSNYQNEQGHSPLFLRHLQSVADLLETTLGREEIVEIGCGKGLFLELLAARGFDIIGVDPTYEGSNPRIIRALFDADTPVRGRGIVLRHVLEHIPDPVGFLDIIRKANGGQGKIYIEVPCFDWICHHRTWFDVFYEHVNYFRLGDFERMFGTVLHAARTFGGQYLSIVADLSSLRAPQHDPSDAVAFPPDFAPGPELARLSSGAIWGASSKGVLFSLFAERAGGRVAAAIDINPAKQGRFLPATGIPIVSPEDAMEQLPDGATIYVMNSNYLPEIRDMSGNRYKYIGLDRD